MVRAFLLLLSGRTFEARNKRNTDEWKHLLRGLQLQRRLIIEYIYDALQWITSHVASRGLMYTIEHVLREVLLQCLRDLYSDR